MKITEKELVNKWIKELEEAGYTYDEMIDVFILAKLKYEKMILKKTGGKINLKN